MVGGKDGELEAAGGSDRRQAPRIPAEMRVEFRHLGRPQENYAELSRDISTGGVFVRTSVGLDVGTELELEIAPGPGAPPIFMRAEVVRVEEEPGETGSRATNRTKGMALRFLRCEAHELDRLISLANQMNRNKNQEGASPGNAKKR